MNLSDKRPEERPTTQTFTLRPQLGPQPEIRPQRWPWALLVRPLDRTLERAAGSVVDRARIIGMRFFWFDGLFATASDNFYITFIPLFALAYNASNSTIGIMTAVANLLGTIALFPGARITEHAKKLKPIVVGSGGGVGRIVLVVLVALPFFAVSPAVAVIIIIVINAIRSFTGNFGNPAWTVLTAELIPSTMRGRYFGMRNTIMGIAALVTAPFAGWVIQTGNHSARMPYLGYQLLFLLALVTGLASTYSYNRIPEPESTARAMHPHRKGDLRGVLRTNRAFTGFVASAFVWNLALQVAGPFFNVYLVVGLHGDEAAVGTATGIANLTNLIGLFIFARLIDRKGNNWVMKVTGLLIPFLPLSWVFMNQIWEVYLNNVFSGFLWAGYNLANFNLLLELAPEDRRPRTVAFYQTVVFAAAVVGPVLGGYLADAVSFKLVFLLSWIGRYIGMFIFMWLVRDRPATAGKESAR